MQITWNSIERKLVSLYGETDASALCVKLSNLVETFQAERAAKEPRSVDESDAALIVYADSITRASSEASPLQSLATFLTEIDAQSFLSTVHLLPFYPWDTDRGFSVKNYYQVDPNNGSWEDVSALAEGFRLMFDFVANHASIENPLIQSALIVRHLKETDSRYSAHIACKDFVIAFDEKEVPSDAELAALTRPRAAPVLSRSYIAESSDGALCARLGAPENENSSLGQGWVWTTFSRVNNDDGSVATRQVDLNFKNPQVLLESIKILLFYCEHGASLIRLDAIGYLWKKLGSSSIHEAETHELLAVMHDVMQVAAPEVLSVAEVNERQDKVIEYLGSREATESDLVYQFSHFPLAVNAVQSETAQQYSTWLESLEPFEGRQFITVLGSHDGLGMKPARGLLSEAELEAFEQRLIDGHGGRANFATLSGGKKIVYEVCGAPWDLINRRETEEFFELQVARYLAVVSLGLIPRGLPAFYINGLLGSANYEPQAGLDENRTVNREVFSISALRSALESDGDRASSILDGIRHLLSIRATQPAFRPNAPHYRVLSVSDSLVTVVLCASSPNDNVFCAVNITSQETALELVLKDALPGETAARDLLSGENVPEEKALSFAPFQARWIRR